MNASARPTAGHHFGDLLACPQRAWLHYFGDASLQVEDPPYLRALQQEGLAHERDVYARWYPGAVDIAKVPMREQRDATEAAMRQGAPAILQAHLDGPGAIGKVDVLEWVRPEPASANGHLYRVGEIKRSQALRTAHVLQAAWYAYLLREEYGQPCWEAFFLLGNGERQIVDLHTVDGEFESAREQLLAMRHGGPEPGPHLTMFCASCHWRGVCGPRLREERHLSLIPGLGRRQTQALASAGINSWADLADAPDAVLAALGLDAYEIERVRVALARIALGQPALRQAVRADALDGLCAVAAEFPDLRAARRVGERPRPSAIHFESAAGQGCLPVPPDGPADLSPLQSEQGLIVFGGTDLGAVGALAREAGVRLPRTIDLLRFVEDFVHAPLLGLDLESLYAEAVGRDLDVPLRGGAVRMGAIRAVVEWIRQAL